MVIEFFSNLFDRALRSVREDSERVEYIHLNPVKAGWATHPEEGPWSSVPDYNRTMKNAPETPEACR